MSCVSSSTRASELGRFELAQPSTRERAARSTPSPRPGVHVMHLRTEPCRLAREAPMANSDSTAGGGEDGGGERGESRGGVGESGCDGGGEKANDGSGVCGIGVFGPRCERRMLERKYSGLSTLSVDAPCGARDFRPQRPRSRKPKAGDLGRSGSPPAGVGGAASAAGSGGGTSGSAAAGGAAPSGGAALALALAPALGRACQKRRLGRGCRLRCLVTSVSYASSASRSFASTSCRTWLAS